MSKTLRVAPAVQPAHIRPEQNHPAVRVSRAGVLTRALQPAHRPVRSWPVPCGYVRPSTLGRACLGRSTSCPARVLSPEHSRPRIRSSFCPARVLSPEHSRPRIRSSFCPARVLSPEHSRPRIRTLIHSNSAVPSSFVPGKCHGPSRVPAVQGEVMIMAWLVLTLAKLHSSSFFDHKAPKHPKYSIAHSKT